MTEARLDQLGVLTLGDKERSVGVAHVVETTQQRRRLAARPSL